MDLMYMYDNTRATKDKGNLVNDGQKYVHV